MNEGKAEIIDYEALQEKVKNAYANWGVLGICENSVQLDRETFTHLFAKSGENIVIKIIGDSISLTVQTTDTLFLTIL